ncbi:MAG: FAD:protein FMN transferase [Planctomycetota bacterium]|nr:MAG: FAD:protein FMN transferase [Planctomycetota bacterium]
MRLSLISDSAAAAAWLLAAACAAAPAAPAAAPATVERRLGLMGTTLELSVEAPGRAQALAASETAVRALEDAEARLSTWRPDSELSALNAAPVGRPVRLSPATYGALCDARAAWIRTGGAFDPSVGALVAAWGLRSGGRVPAAAEREAALRGVGLDALRLEAGTATRTRAELLLEEGGFGKGAGLDRALEALAATAATRALLDLGGQVAVYGRGPFFLAVSDPRERGRPVLRLRIDHGSVATSGNSEHGFAVDGARYGHILDPRSGAPAPDFGSVTVWAPRACWADALATGYFVLGPEDALARAGTDPGCAALFLEVRGARLRARATSGWQGRVQALVPDVDLEWFDRPPPTPE